jgi:hypothetical protein
LIPSTTGAVHDLGLPRLCHDLTDAEWQLLAPLIPAPKLGGRPPLHDRRELLNPVEGVWGNIKGVERAILAADTFLEVTKAAERASSAPGGALAGVFVPAALRVVRW